MAAELEITCPYCGSSFFTGKPELPGEPEVKCVPYTRLAGQMEPQNEGEWYDPKCWSRIGKDYLGWLNWERIGILRVAEPGIDVRFRIQHCKSCERLFDAYANYTPEKTLDQLWPHLFGLKPGEQAEIRPYSGESWALWLVRRMGKLAKSIPLGAILLGLLLYLAGLAGIYMARGAGPRPVFLTSGWALLYGIAALSFSVGLIFEERYVSYLESTRDFHDLMKVQNKSWGVIHWRNYTLCRFVGVQEPGRLPKPTQADLVAGGISVALLLITRIFYYPSGLIPLAVILASLAAGVLSYQYFSHHEMHFAARSIRPAVSAAAFLAVLMAGGFGWMKLPGPDRLPLAADTLDLIFWIMIAYFIGTAAWLAMNTAYFVMQGLSRVPMDLSPYDQFAKAKAIRSLRGYSTRVLLLLFLTLIALVTVLQGMEQPAAHQMQLERITFLLEWMRWGAAIIFASLGFALGRGEYLGIALFYGVISWLLNYKIPLANQAFFIDGPVLTLGIFFTLLIGFQILRVDGLVNHLLQTAKDVEIAKLQGHIDAIRSQVLQLDEKISTLNRLHYSTSRGKESSTDLQTQRQAALDSIESLLRITDRVEKVQVKPQRFKQLFEFLAPLLSSVALPLLSEFLSPYWADFIKDVLKQGAP